MRPALVSRCLLPFAFEGHAFSRFYPRCSGFRSEQHDIDGEVQSHQRHGERAGRAERAGGVILLMIFVVTLVTGLMRR